jgi:hypothetical protein
MNQDSHTTLPAFIVLSHEEIAARAYEVDLQRGASEGFGDTPVLKRIDRCR